MENHANIESKGPFLYLVNDIITDVNDELLELTGYSRADFFGKSLEELTNIFKISSQINFEDIKNECECFIFTKDFEPREVSIKSVTLNNDTDKFYYIIEKKNSSFKEKFPYVEQLCRDNYMGVAVHSVPDLMLLRANQKYLDLMVHPYNKIENCIATKLTQRDLGMEQSEAYAIWQETIKQSRTYNFCEYEYDHFKRGTTYWDASIVPISENGRVKYIVETVQDVTEKILNRQRIETQNNKISELNKVINDNFLYGIIDTLDLAFFRISYPDLKVKSINRKAAKVIKSINPDLNNTSSVIGKYFGDVITNFDENSLLSHIESLLENHEISFSKHKTFLIEKEEMYFRMLYQPMFNPDGVIEEIIGVAIDITSETKMNLEMEKTIQMQEELLANISHELKTPLNVIYSTVQLFNMYYKNGSWDKNTDSIIKHMDSVMKNCYRLSKLINNIVDLSKINAGFYEMNLSFIDIVNLIDDIISSVSEYTDSKGIKIIQSSDIKRKVITCDPEKIERVILNLISNAIKFSNAGDEINVSIHDKNSSVEISVKDSGIGIDPKDINMIFDRFRQVDKSYTRNFEGAGIGLCIVKSIVELHGGGITVKSELGKGSEFIVELPAVISDKVKSSYRNNTIYSSNEIVKIEFSDIYV